jgi:hypothetical protein
MLRVETQKLDGSLLCRLEGRFTGEGAEQVRTLVTHCDSGLRLLVDLTDMMFVDGIGEQVLSFAKKLGAQFIAETAYSRDVCERLSLPITGKPKANSELAGHSNGNGRHPDSRSRHRRVRTNSHRVPVGPEPEAT